MGALGFYAAGIWHVEMLLVFAIIFVVLCFS